MSRAITTVGTTTTKAERVTTERVPRFAARRGGGVPCQIEAANRDREWAKGLELDAGEADEVGELTAATAVFSVPAAPACARSAGGGSLTKPVSPVWKSAVRAAGLRWSARVRLITKRSRAVAPRWLKTEGSTIRGLCQWSVSRD